MLGRLPTDRLDSPALWRQLDSDLRRLQADSFGGRAPWKARAYCVSECLDIVHELRLRGEQLGLGIAPELVEPRTR